MTGVAHLGQNWRIVSDSPLNKTETRGPNLMHHRPDGIPREGIRGAFDDVEFSGLGNDPEVALLVADAAVAFKRRFDLGELGLVHERSAVTVAAVRPQFALGGRGGSHVGSLGINWLAEKWSSIADFSIPS
jgi:hypothetical protein